MPVDFGSFGANRRTTTRGEPFAPVCSTFDDQMRRDDVAAVREHRVERRHLERGHEQVLLPDRELDRVARVPRAVPVRLERLPAPVGRGQEPELLAADVEAGGRAEAERARPLLHAHPALRAALVEAVPDLVEVGVAGLRERLGESHRAVGVRVPVDELLLVEPVVRDGRALERVVRADDVLLHRRERGDGLPRRAGRVEARGGAVQARRVREARCFGDRAAA